ncbi:hypothetical protein BYT27DRAFT_7336378 [Phlegmacium glaucopus]|nr:hypothetical protein BYT27DRAFT_7336378 [Phlegmacium glaucopus]
MQPAPISPLVDPRGILEKLTKEGFLHGEENEVHYYQVHKNDAGGKTSVETVNPQIFRIGDIVEAQVSFIVVPLKDNKHKMIVVLRLIALLDTHFSKKAANSLKRESKKDWIKFYYCDQTAMTFSNPWNEKDDDFYVDKMKIVLCNIWAKAIEYKCTTADAPVYYSNIALANFTKAEDIYGEGLKKVGKICKLYDPSDVMRKLVDSEFPLMHQGVEIKRVAAQVTHMPWHQSSIALTSPVSQ